MQLSKKQSQKSYWYREVNDPCLFFFTLTLCSFEKILMLCWEVMRDNIGEEVIDIKDAKRNMLLRNFL